MKYLVVILFFFTLWIVFVLVVVYLTRRRTSRAQPNMATAPLTLHQALPAAPRAGATCCLQVPCSAACAAEHQRQRELLDMDHGRVAAELRKILELENDPYPADLEQ